MHTLRIAAVAALLGAAGCADPGLHLASDPPGAGAALWIEGELGPETLDLELWGRELGSVFGWSAHVGYDPAALEADTASVEAAALDPDAADEAVALVTGTSGDVGLGASRRSPGLGGVEVAAPTLLARMRLAVVDPAPSAIALNDVMVRRLDGSFVPVAIAGAQVVQGGE